MFYQVDQIESKLTCPTCSNRFNEPKILPCGRIVCLQCIQKVVDMKSLDFICFLCDETHQVPKQGFPTCSLISELIKETPYEIYRGKSAETLKTYLRDIQFQIDDLNNNLNNGIDKIKEHCIDLRNDVQLATETTIQYINELNQSMINRINDYEKICIDQYENEQEYKEKFVRIIKEMRSFHKEWENYLKMLTIDDDEILNAIELAKSKKSNLDIEKKHLKGFTFNNQLLKFNKNILEIDKNILGSLNLNKINILFENLDKTNVSNLLPEFNRSSGLVEVESIENGNFLIVYQNTANCLNILKYSLNSKHKLSEKTIGEPRALKSLKLKKHKNFIVLLALDSTKSSCFLVGLDENLTLMRQFDFGAIMNIIAIGTNDSGLFCLTSRPNSPMDVFNWQLQYAKSIGQSNNSNLGFYFPQNIKQLDHRNSKYIWLNSASLLNILDEVKGGVNCSIRISGDRFLFDSNSNIIVMSDSAKKISYFNFNGILLNEIDLLKFPANVLFLIDTNDNFVFFDKNQLCFFK